MPTPSRRNFLRTMAAASFAAPAIHAKSATDVRIQDVTYSYEDFLYRTPIKFGGSVVDRVTLLNVNCVVRSTNGKTVKGFGSMPLGNVWSYPSKVMNYDATLHAMKVLAERMSKIMISYKEAGHPMDINHAIEPLWMKAAAAISTELKLPQPIPKLCTLVTGSAFDAALNDAYGKLHNRNIFSCYTQEFMDHDLSHYIGDRFKGEYADRYVMKTPKPTMPLYHLVGAVDPLTPGDVKKPIGDGLPEDLAAWIVYSGLDHMKIKLNGEDNKWDIDRVLAVDRVATETQRKRGVTHWVYSLDFNEKCPNAGYLVEFLKTMKQKSPQGFERIQYVEQPTKRDLQLDRANVMFEASKIRPVVIDESLTGYDALMLAREMGYTGAALKACKGQSEAVLMAAVCQKYKMFLCVQDLTCPGASLIHSASIAAHIPGVAAIEANGRQYVPAANKGWEKKFPGVFDVRNGKMNTSLLNGPGLGAV
jgi:L-alanine-DL-glutamate epimerase-like enolase superfamily enzyme